MGFSGAELANNTIFDFHWSSFHFFVAGLKLFGSEQLEPTSISAFALGVIVGASISRDFTFIAEFPFQFTIILSITIVRARLGNAVAD